MQFITPKGLVLALTACVGMNVGTQTRKLLQPLIICTHAFVCPTLIKIRHSYIASAQECLV